MDIAELKEKKSCSSIFSWIIFEKKRSKTKYFLNIEAQIYKKKQYKLLFSLGLFPKYQW